MKTPLDLLTDRYRDIKKARRLAFSNNNFEDYEKIKQIEMQYYSSIELIKNSLNFNDIIKPYYLTDFQKNDIITNCKTRLARSHVNSTTSYGKKYNLKVKSVANLLKSHKLNSNSAAV